MKGPRQQSIKTITETRDDEYDQRPEIVPVHQMNHHKWDEDHAQKGELIGSGEDLRELQVRSLEAWVCGGASPDTCCGALSAVAGSSPVLAKNRCEREGKLPSGRSSSTRSMRCMGKNTTAGVKGSPSFTITVRSSKEASSTPLRLNPSVARVRIMPQNFSRGLHSVTITTDPDRKGSRAPATKLKPVLEGLLSTERLSRDARLIASSRNPGFDRLVGFKVPRLPESAPPVKIKAQLFPHNRPVAQLV